MGLAVWAELNTLTRITLKRILLHRFQQLCSLLETAYGQPKKPARRDAS